jgi:guanylate kinase
MTHPRVFVVSGPSGVGKTSILKAVRQATPGMRMSVSCTTRPPRPTEVHGRDYFFLTRAAFEQRIAEGDFLEWATVYDNYYGTSLGGIRDILASRVHALLDIDTQGARSIRARCDGAVLIFIEPPSLTVLEERLRGRRTESEESLAKRLRHADHEMRQRGLYDYVIVNDSIAKATGRFLEIIAIEQERNVPFTIRTTPAEEARAVQAIAGGIDQERILRGLETELQATLGVEVSSWIRQRMETVLRRDLETIVREEYRAYQASRVD